jgi:hypothetical protein
MKESASGYSATPLARKLGITGGTRVLTKNAPEDYPDWLEPVPPGVIFEKRLSETTDVVHVFAAQKDELAMELSALRTRIRKDAVVWVSWPKKSAKLPTDITDNAVREVALPLGFVDVKVCAVSEVWSGLKLYIRRELR